MKCPSCERDVPQGARFCAYCGISVRVCDTCNTVWPAEAAFCGTCGESIAAEPARKAAQATERLVAPGSTAEVDESIAMNTVTSDSELGFLYLPKYPDQRYVICEGELTIGAGDKNDIIIERPAISWNHALLIARQTGVRLQDSASTNGTFVNEERLNRPQVIKHGDVIRFGNVELKLWLRPSMRR